MADFSPQDLVDQAKDLYGEDTLRQRVFPDAPTPADADTELLRIARTVVSRVAAAAASSVGWPLPGAWPAGSTDIDGNDISGVAYREMWPDDLLQRALELYNFRTYGGFEGEVAPKIQGEGAAAEKYFMAVAKGTIGLGVGGLQDLSSPAPISARDRQGRNLLNDGAADMDRMIDTFRGAGWDWV